MKMYFCWLVAALVLANTARTQKCFPLSKSWADYTISNLNKEIYLSIFRTTDGSIKGNCRFENDEQNIFDVTGTEKDCHYSLYLFNSKKEQKGKMLFQYQEKKINNVMQDVYSGTFTDSSGKEATITPVMNSMVYGSLTQRYGIVGTTQEVDSFAAKIKTAFISGDKEWLSSHCRYPLRINLPDKKSLAVKDKQGFLANYNKYFSKSYIDKIKKIKCFNMFSKVEGVNMGDLVWLNVTAASTADKYEYCIISFNVL